MTICREPGCTFEATAPRYSPPDGRCDHCRGEQRCSTRRCSNVAQRGDLCRVCASIARPGEVFFIGRWRPIREAITRVMRDPVMKNVKWAVENGKIVGRDGTLEIVLKHELWEPKR